MEHYRMKGPAMNLRKAAETAGLLAYLFAVSAGRLDRGMVRSALASARNEQQPAVAAS